MTEKATIYQTVQAGIESVAGTPVAANKRLIATGMRIGPKVESDVFRAAGQKYARFVTLNKEWTELPIEGKLTYNEILYLLSSLISQPTPVQQGATAAYLWTFNPNTSSPDAGKTLTIEQGDSVSAWRAAGVRVSGLEFTFNRNEVNVSGSALGEQIETGITLTAGPTELTALPVLPAHLSFRMATTQAGLTGATPLTRGFSMVWSLMDKIGLAWPVGQDPVAVETEPKLESTLRLAADATGMGLVANMRAGDTRWFQVKGVGALIASTYYQTFQLQFPAQISNMSDFSDEDGIYAVEYTLAGIHDSTWGKAFQIDVITNLQTL
jgi:hypothetical protein